jgi:hypothetical protein
LRQHLPSIGDRGRDQAKSPTQMRDDMDDRNAIFGQDFVRRFDNLFIQEARVPTRRDRVAVWVIKETQVQPPQCMIGASSARPSPIIRCKK